MNIIIWLVVGAIAGWLAGNIMKGRGFGLIGNIIIGIVGGILGGYLFGLIGLSLSLRRYNALLELQVWVLW